MCVYRPSRNKLILLSLILIQLCLIASYLFFFKSVFNTELSLKSKRISFFAKSDVSNESPKRKYYTIGDVVNLQRSHSRQFYMDFNSSMCFAEGTDIMTMYITKGVYWKCNCFQGWHGADCGTPEVLFRALLAKKQSTKLKGPTTFMRRLIYVFEYSRSTESLVDMRLTTLGDIVDLFVLHESGNFFEKHLKKKMLQDWQHKILYFPRNNDTNVWKIVETQIKNLRSDDYIISSPTSGVPDRASLLFLKFYENVPELIHFRLKWSVFGFFWVHPKKTIISDGACSVAYLRDNLNNDLDALTNSKTLANLSPKGMILGDLNRTGGWFCEYCALPEDIMEYIMINKTRLLIDWNKIGTTKITYKFIQNLIEFGVYIDGTTKLERADRQLDVDFAPPLVMSNNYKFDFVLMNFYARNEFSQYEYYM